MLANQSLTDVLDAFSSSAPTPGGGSASALAGALGASLLAMVAALPKTKNNTPEERASLDAARAKLLTLRARLNEIFVKHTGQEVSVIEEAMERDRFMSPEEAKTFGLVDEVVTHRPVAADASADETKR